VVLKYKASCTESAASRGAAVVAITTTTERVARMRSRFHHGQFYASISMDIMYLVLVHTNGSLGLLLGWGTRMILPVGSRFNVVFVFN